MFNLSASATRDDLSLIAVVMKAPSSAIRFKNATALLDFGFNNFEYKKMINKGDIIKFIKVNKGVKNEVNIIADEGCGSLVQKGNDINIEQKIEMPDVINAPVKQGDVVGCLKYTLVGETVGECNLVINEDIEKMNLLNMEQHVLDRWFTLLR